MSLETKFWGKRPFWGLSFDFDPQWYLTDEQKEIQRRLIELCRTTLRRNALVSDQYYEYPHKNMKALASQGLLGLIIPKEFGGMGQNHVCMAMVVETIARYGCPSTAMVCVMHYIAVGSLLFRHHNNALIQDLLRRVNEETLIGTISYSDPATGGHFWYPMSSRTQMTADGRIKILKCGSWATSAGLADFYVITTISPQFDGDFSHLSSFLLYKDEVRADNDDWKSLGMHGNQSRPMVCEATVDEDRLIGPYGDGKAAIDEVGSPRFLLLTAACWNGIAMGAMDIARHHVTTKEHADVGMRIADYPTIQVAEIAPVKDSTCLLPVWALKFAESLSASFSLTSASARSRSAFYLIKDYFGDAVSGTNACRIMAFSVAQLMDHVTDNNDWNIYKDPKASLRIGALHPCWSWQLKYECAKNVNNATDKMMQACGGAGFKRDLGVERLLRDGRAGWVMGPSNEVIKQFVGKSSLFGVECLDIWSQSANRRTLNAELLKLKDEEKLEIAQQLMREVEMNGPLEKSDSSSYQDTEFDNPFNTRPSVSRGPITDVNGTEHLAALSPDCFFPLKLLSVIPMGDKQAEFQFALPQASQHTGCLPGQYVQVRVPLDKDGEKYCQRYFSPVNATTDFGRIDLVMKFESHGQLSQRFKALTPGDLVEFRGPCGGFEYESNSVKHISLVVSGSGATPCIQIVRDIMADPGDQTSVSMLYSAETESEFMFKSELDDHSARDERFRVFYTLSKGAGQETWQGGEGHIDKDMISNHLVGPQVLEHKVLLCGGPTMIVSVMRILFQMGYSSHQIFVYGPFGAELVRAVFGRNARLSSHRFER